MMSRDSLLQLCRKERKQFHMRNTGVVPNMPTTDSKTGTFTCNITRVSTCGTTWSLMLG